jgi:hypothetical protein
MKLRACMDQDTDIHQNKVGISNHGVAHCMVLLTCAQEGRRATARHLRYIRWIQAKQVKSGRSPN